MMAVIYLLVPSPQLRHHSSSHATIGPSPLSPLELNVSFSFYTVFSDQFVSPLFLSSMNGAEVWDFEFTPQDV